MHSALTFSTLYSHQLPTSQSNEVINLTFYDNVLVGLSHAPYYYHGIQGAAGHHAAVRAPSHTVDACIVEAPLYLVELFICGKGINHHLKVSLICTLFIQYDILKVVKVVMLLKLLTRENKLYK